jgi:Peroxisomal membrane protein (Pex16)
MVAAPSTCDEPLVLPCTKEEEEDMVVEEYTSSHAAVMTRNSRRSLWDTYQTWARHHQTHLWYWDDAISRLLFFFSSSTSSSSSNDNDNDDTKSLSSSWREIIWGLLELHRLALHHATNKLDSGRNSGDDDHERLPVFGTTVEVGTTTPPSATTNVPSFVPTIRWALTILQTLYPIIHEVVVVVSSSRRSNNSITSSSSSSSSWKVRRYLERTRFLLRLLLLLQYWNCLPPEIAPGLLIRGGGMVVVEDDDSDRQRRRQRRMVTMADQQEVVARRNVQNYVGQRTGKRLFFLARNSTDAAVQRSLLLDNKVLLHHLRIKVSELLYIARPLLYTELLSQQQQPPLTSTTAVAGIISPAKAWVVAVVLDLLSLWGLHLIGNDSSTTGGKRCHNNINAEQSSREWRRRRLRLFLYVLRAPVWEQYTEPIAQHVMGASLCRNVPVVGNLLSSYFWDWLSYWRDYRLEEG